MINILRKSKLFFNWSDLEIQKFIDISSSYIKTYSKNEMIFGQLDIPKYIYVLLSGRVSINKDSISGKNTLITTIDDIGDIFAEVYLFLEKEEYDFYTLSLENNTKILKIPKDFFTNTSNIYNQKLRENLLFILSNKAYNLTKKLQIISNGTLRQKIARFLLSNTNNNVVKISINRTQTADYLNVTRPSLSRELSNMQNDGLITINKSQINILDLKSLEELI